MVTGSCHLLRFCCNLCSPSVIEAAARESKRVTAANKSWIEPSGRSVKCCLEVRSLLPESQYSLVWADAGKGTVQGLFQVQLTQSQIFQRTAQCWALLHLSSRERFWHFQRAAWPTHSLRQSESHIPFCRLESLGEVGLYLHFAVPSWPCTRGPTLMLSASKRSTTGLTDTNSKHFAVNKTF